MIRIVADECPVDHRSVSWVCTNCIQSNMRIWCDVSPLFAAAVNPRRLLWRGLEDGSEDGNILLEDDRRHGEVSLQLVGALTEVLRQVGHVLPLLHLIKELYEAAEDDSRLWGGAAQLQPFMLHILIYWLGVSSTQVHCGPTSSLSSAGFWSERRSSPRRYLFPQSAPRTCRPRTEHRPASAAHCPAGGRTWQRGERGEERTMMRRNRRINEKRGGESEEEDGSQTGELICQTLSVIRTEPDDRLIIFLLIHWWTMWPIKCHKILIIIRTSGERTTLVIILVKVMKPRSENTPVQVKVSKSNLFLPVFLYLMFVD